MTWGQHHFRRRGHGLKILGRVFLQLIGNASASEPIGKNLRRFFVKLGKVCVVFFFCQTGTIDINGYFLDSFIKLLACRYMTNIGLLKLFSLWTYAFKKKKKKKKKKKFFFFEIGKNRPFWEMEMSPFIGPIYIRRKNHSFVNAKYQSSRLCRSTRCLNIFYKSLCKTN